jgi:Bacterial Ig-like domain
VPDRTGLVAISAVVNSPGTTNNIFITFSESVGGSSVAPAAFRLLHRATQQPVNISNAVASAQIVRLSVSGAAWRAFDDYILTINGIKDLAGNGIALDTQLPVGWWIQTNVVSILGSNFNRSMSIPCHCPLSRSLV